MHKKSSGPTDTHIGQRVRQRRVALGMSQERLGEALGVTFQQVQKYEKGTNRIGASRLLHIAQVLGVGIEFFFEGLPDIPVAASSDRAMAEFLTMPESDRLMRGFLRLKDGDARRKVADLIDWLATSN